MPIPPRLYGGIERIVDSLVAGLSARGHRVTLFAHPESTVACRLKPYGGSSSRARVDVLRNMFRVSAEILRGGYDLAHSFGRLAYLLPIMAWPTPKLMSYQRAITKGSFVWGERLSRGTLHFAACSRFLLPAGRRADRWHVVHNSVPGERFEYRESVGEAAPLVFLGRIEAIKGAHLAIEVARRAGRELVIAGNVPEGAKHRAYFDREIAPVIDGRAVVYAGPVGDREKNNLLGRAAALLFPVMWDEPFGIVMAEALACGTPVIGLARGAVPEVVQDGVTGFVCAGVDEMVAAVPRLREIDRKACRRVMEARFSDTVMVSAYEALYRRLCAREAATS